MSRCRASASLADHAAASHRGRSSLLPVCRRGARMAVRVGRDVLDAMSRTRVGTTRTLLAVAFALCFSAVPGQSAATMDLPSASSWRPDGLFLQSGWGKRVQATVFGAKWDWQWEQEFAGGRASGYWEASFGRWHAEAGASPAGSAWVTQLGLTPVLRWRPGTIGDEWYVELGIGANVVMRSIADTTSGSARLSISETTSPWAGASEAAASTRLHYACSTFRTRGSSTRTRARTSCNCATAGATELRTRAHRHCDASSTAMRRRSSTTVIC